MILVKKNLLSTVVFDLPIFRAAHANNVVRGFLMETYKA